MSLSKHQQAILALVLANIIWGAASPIFKWSLTNIHPFTLAFFRFAFASLLLLPFCAKKLRVKEEDWPNLIYLTLCGITFNITFFFLGLKLAPSINAPIIATAGPIFLIMGSLFFLKEKLKLKVALGTIIGCAGVAIIILRPFLESGFNQAVLGNLFFVIAALGAVGHVIFMKRVIANYDALTITFWSFAIGALSFLPSFYFEIKSFGFLPNLALPGATGLLFGIFLSSALAYSLYDWAIKNIWAQEVGIFSYLDPLIAIVIAAPLLGENPTPTYILGSVLVFSGIFIAEGRIPYHPFHRLIKTKELPVKALPLLAAPPHEELLPPPNPKDYREELLTKQ